MRLGILKTDSVRPELSARFGEYPDMFMRLLESADPQLLFCVYDVEQGQLPADIDECDAYLITGSRVSAYDDVLWIPPLTTFIETLHTQQKKLIGICFGHQLIAQALGGAVEKSPKGWGVGLHTHEFCDLPWWHDGEAPGLDILVSHQDQVVRPPCGAQVVARSDFCEFAALQMGDHVLTFQGHPEFVTDYARALMEARVDVIEQGVHERGMASLSGEHQGVRVAKWIVNFLRGAPKAVKS